MSEAGPGDVLPLEVLGEIVRAWLGIGRAPLTEIKYVSCTHGEATHAVSGGGLADSAGARRRVWLVQIPGDFELTAHYGPARSPNPTGGFLQLVVDQETCSVIGRGIGNKEVELGLLGDVNVLRPRSVK